jgi:SNF family Na+-dependent transporter
MIVMGLAIGSISTMVGNVGGVVFLIVYPVLGVLYIFPCLFLSRYASTITQFESSHQRADLENALDAQRSFWKFVGIMALVGLVLALVAIPLAIIAGVAGAMLVNQR